MDEDTFMSLCKEAITAAKKTALKGRLTITELSVAKLLDPIRKPDWTPNTENQTVIRPLETRAHSSALLLQERGIKPSSACDLCLRTKNKPFESCVCAPSFRRYALRLGACANCIWHGREKHCSLRREFVASGGKEWMFTLDLVVLDGGGLLYAEGMGRRLKGLPVPGLQSKGLVPVQPVPLQSSRTPAIAARKAVSSKPATGRQLPITESKVEARRGDKSSLPARRLAGDSTSASILGKRSADLSIEPLHPTKRTRHSKDNDGKLVPWPCTSSSWNDPDALKTIYSDLQGYMRAVKRRIEELEAAHSEKTS